MSQWIGQRLNERFLVESRLGQGGMAAVYLARDERLEGRRVVVKHPLRESDRLGGGLSDEELRWRFRSEVSRLIQLDDIPSVVPILDQGVHEGTPFYVMRHMAGGSLAGVLERGPQGPRETLAWLRPIAEALDRLHERGVLHRDVKPDNLLFDLPPTGPKAVQARAHLSDFGIVKELSAEWATTGRSNTGIGTAGYMAPEQLLEDAQPDGRADQFSLAATLYHALTGSRPRYATSPDADGRRSLTPVHALATNVPEPVSFAIARAMGREPVLRFSTCTEFASAVESAIPPAQPRAPAERESPTRRPMQDPGPVGAASAGTAPPSRRGGLTRWVAFAALVLALSLGALALWRSAATAELPDPAQPTAPGAEPVDMSPAPAATPPTLVAEVPPASPAEAPPTPAPMEVPAAPAPTSPDVPERGPEPPMAPEPPPRDETPPTLEVHEPTDASVTTTSASVTLRGQVVDADAPPAAWRLRDGATSIPLDDSGRFVHEVALAVDETRTVTLVASDGAGNESPPVTRTLHREALWAADLRSVASAALEGRWEDVRSALVRVQEAGLPEARIPAAIREGLKAWDAPPTISITNPSTGRVSLSRTILVAGTVQGARPNDRLLVHGRPTSVDPEGRFDTDVEVPAEGLHEIEVRIERGRERVARVVAHVTRRAPWRTHVERASDAAASAEWPKVRELLWDGRGLGMSDDDVPEGVRHGVRQDDERALSPLREAVRSAPKDVDARHSLAVELHNRHRFSEAAPLYREVLREKPEFATAHYNLGLILKALKDHDDAIAAFREAIRLDAKNELTDARTELARALLLASREKEAIEASRAAIRVGPPDPEEWVLLSMAQSGDDDPGGALESARAAVRLAPENAAALHQLGHAWWGVGALDEAASTLRKSARLAPAVRGCLAECLYAAGDTQAALGVATEAVRDAGAVAYVTLSDARGSLGDFAGALEHARDAVAAAPEHGGVFMNLAAASIRLERAGEAAEAVRRAHALLMAQMSAADATRRARAAILLRTGQLLRRWPAVRADAESVQGPEDLCALFWIAHAAEQRTLAVETFERVLVNRSGVDADLLLSFQYDAACSAASGAARRGRDVALLSDADRSGLRSKALDWLRGILNARRSTWQATNPHRLRALLLSWKRDRDLADTRDGPALSSLPDAEQRLWKTCWSDIDALIARLPAPP